MVKRYKLFPQNKCCTLLYEKLRSFDQGFKGVLLIFTKEKSATNLNRDTEEFYNPKMKKVEVTVEGSPNELYAHNVDTATIMMTL